MAGCVPLVATFILKAKKLQFGLFGDAHYPSCEVTDSPVNRKYPQLSQCQNFDPKQGRNEPVETEVRARNPACASSLCLSVSNLIIAQQEETD